MTPKEQGSIALRRFVVLMALWAIAAPAAAAEPLRIGIGYGLAFLPIYVCQDLKLFEKYARQEHLEVKPDYQRFSGAGPLRDALAKGDIDVGPFGIAPLLLAWEQGKDTPRQVLAVSGVTTLPLALLSNQPNVQSLADLKPSDRIALPTPSAPQRYLLEMQAEKVFGHYDKLDAQVVVQSHVAAIAALIAGTSPVTAYFSSPPFTQLALRDARIHQVLSSTDVIGGKSSFLILGATRGYIAAHPQIPEVIDKAMDEAAQLIERDPRRAAQIYLTHEPSKTFDAAAIQAVLADDKDAFGSALYGIQAFADFMAKHGELKASPQSWKDIVAPALSNSPSD